MNGITIIGFVVCDMVEDQGSVTGVMDGMG